MLYACGHSVDIARSECGRAPVIRLPHACPACRRVPIGDERLITLEAR